MLHQDEDEDNLTEYEDWYIKNEWDFPRELRDLGMEFIDFELFYYRVYKPIVADLVGPLHRVMMEQHPSLSRELRPRIVEKINEIVPELAHEWIVQLFVLVFYDEKGYSLPEKYECFDYWKTNNMDPDYDMKQYYPHCERYKDYSDEEIEELDDEFLIIELKSHRYHARRRAKVYDALMLPVLKHFDKILNLSADAWVVLAGLSDHFISEYGERAYKWDIFFKFGFPEEYIDMDPMKYYEVLQETHKAKIYWCLKCGQQLSEEDLE